MEATVILPNQLYANHPHILGVSLYLVEEDTYFTRYRFHKKKLILHRASMKAYQASLNKEIHYIENQRGKTLSHLFEVLKSEKINKIKMTEVLDHKLEYRLRKLSKEHGIELRISCSPGFLTNTQWIQDFFSSHRFHMTSFYIAQRKRMKILTENGKAVGGKWSFDPENRKRLPKDQKVPDPWNPESNDFVKEATEYILERFEFNPGDHREFNYPVTTEDSITGLNDFVDTRLLFFGDYQDAITPRSRYVFHSLISPTLNIGILSPQKVLDRVIQAYDDQKISLNNAEGFIRQLIGWREYMRAVYLLKGVEMKEGNFWGYSRALPDSFYSASTGLAPLDDILSKVNQTAYAHHIERLMVLGNFTLLTGVDPKNVFNWFMEMFIDSYEWVMVPNVMAMSQYADPSITTKPYISSSSYLTRMSDYPRAGWGNIWDALFWNFIIMNRKKISSIPRMKVILYNLDRMKEEKKAIHVERALEFLEKMRDNFVP